MVENTNPNDDARTSREPRRQLLALMRPPKPISEMTEDERDAFADEMVERMLASYERISSGGNA